MNRTYSQFLAHLSQRLIRLAYSIPVKPASVCMCVRVCVFTFSNMNISETCRPIATKFYLKHHWVGGKDELGFGPDWIRTLVSMATDSSHRVCFNGENIVNTLAPLFLIGSSSYLQVTKTTIISGTSSNWARFDQGLRS